MVLTANPQIAARAKYLTTQAKDDEVRFVHHEVGYNYRLTNLQAALCVAQLEQLPQFLEIKAGHYAQYTRGLDGIPGLTLAPVPGYARNNHWLCALRIEAATYGCDREILMERLAQRGIQARPVWHLNHLQRSYLGCQTYRIERALVLWQTTLNLPSSVGLTSGQVGQVLDALREFGPA